jgi:hypothetical protein
MADYYKPPYERDQMMQRLDNAVRGAATRSQAADLAQAERMKQIAMRGGLDGYSADNQSRSLNMALNDPKMTRSRRDLLLQNAATEYVSSMRPKFDANGRQINTGEISSLASMAELGKTTDEAPARPQAPPPPEPPPVAPPPPQNEAPNLFQGALPAENEEYSAIKSDLLTPQINLTTSSLGSTKVLEKQKPSMFDTALA